TSSRKIRPLLRCAHPDLSVTFRVHPKTFAGRVFSRPGGFHCRIESGSKISSFFRVLPRPSEEPIPALDVLKLRLLGESRKAPKPNFPPTAFFVVDKCGKLLPTMLPLRSSPPSASDSSLLRNQRSRFASRRSRSALSLMKPSASF